MMEVLIPIFLFIGLLIVGTPVGFAFATSGVTGTMMTFGLPATLGILKTTLLSSVASFLLTSIPMYILMAHFLAGGNLMKKIFDNLNDWIGSVPGGLGYASIAASAGMGALTGSSTASTAVMAKLSYPEMIRHGYSQILALGIVGTTGTLAIMIPPSIGLIIYAVFTEQSIEKLFIAGIVPGLLTAFSYCLVISALILIKPGLAPSIKGQKTLHQKIKELPQVTPAILLIFLVLGGIYSGAVTATEAGALGALGSFLHAVFMERLKPKQLLHALTSTATVTAMIFILIIGAHLFSYYLITTMATQKLIEFIGNLNFSRHVVFFLVLGFIIILGAFMDQIAIIVLTLPLIFPLLVDNLGFNPIWLGIVLVKTAEIGLVTPPFGLNVFVTSSSIGGDVLAKTFKGVAIFLVADVIVLFFIIMFPQISLFLTGLMVK